ncbi:UNVERIFIED_CONTAM: Heavy metal-associated isoprenylated plant protein 7 [Sesamum latifolium]|uniref:Heavy metal-associated isoprenylated plant protein 7 n=1 Tax=Sesamum latifolium TaxID=2727402 RepID=A0AAW2WT24_9LAMI
MVVIEGEERGGKQGGGGGGGEERRSKRGEEGRREEEDEVPPPAEIVLKVDMHCEACARKVARALKGFEGVEEVTAEYKTSKVVVKGKDADPVKVCQRIQKKSGRKVEIISPLPKPPPQQNEEQQSKEEPKEEKKEEPPAVITVVLKVRMHCDACAHALQKRIGKIQGVESVTTDIANDQVIVKGVLDPEKLVSDVYKRTVERFLPVAPTIPHCRSHNEAGEECGDAAATCHPLRCLWSGAGQGQGRAGPNRRTHHQCGNVRLAGNGPQLVGPSSVLEDREVKALGYHLLKKNCLQYNRSNPKTLGVVLFFVEFSAKIECPLLPVHITLKNSYSQFPP